jgi:hypothetical protein
MTKASGMIFISLAGPERVSIMDDTNIRLPVMQIEKIKSRVDFINAFPGIYLSGQLHHLAVQNGLRPFLREGRNTSQTLLDERALAANPVQ